MTTGTIDPSLIERFRADLQVTAAWRQADDGLAVAVSGGADSLALLLLANAAFPGAITVASVDHGLRAEAAAECAFVADLCRSLGVPHETLQADVTPGGEGIQAAARQARRLALGNWCQWNRLHFVMTGHHADDQAETVLMRLSRGSGVAGLSGIGRHTALPWQPNALRDGAESVPVTMIRPLLGWRRNALAQIVRDAGLVPIDDPSNRDPRHDRTHFRRMLEGTDLLDPIRLATSATLCGDADLALEWSARTLQRIALDKQHDQALLNLAPLSPWNQEILRRIVIDVFHHLGVGKTVRGSQVIRLLDLLHAGRTATLAGIKVVPEDGVWTFAPAPPRRPARKSADRAH